MDYPAIQSVKHFLDSKRVHYLYMAYGAAYGDNKILPDECELERNQLESVLIRIPNGDRVERAIIVVPVTRRLDLDALKKALGNNRIEFASKQQAQQWFPDQESGALLPFQPFHPEIPLYYSHEILALQDISFCVTHPANRIKMPLADFLAAAAPVNWLDVATVAKYKIEVAQVFPSEQRKVVNESGHCMLGFSLQSQSFTPIKLAGMAEWLSRHFSECTVLVGDGIHRITLEINGMPAELTANRALLMGREVIDGDSAIFNRHRNDCRFHIISTAELQKTEGYHHFFRALYRLFTEDQKFHASVMQFAREFVGNRHQDDAEHLEYCRQLSCQYLLEEVAITALLIQQGVSIFVYPGTLTIMQELSLGQHPGAPKEFGRMISINLRIKRR